MFVIDFTISGAEALKKSEVNAAVRRALVSTGQRWRDRYLQKHFTKAGAREYGYKPRNGELNPRKPGTYTNRKLRLFRHTKPLVYRGELERQALYEVKTVTATADSRGAKVRIQLPKKANFVYRDLTAVSAVELADLSNFLAGALNLELQRAGARRTRTRVSIGDGGGESGAAAA